MTESKNICTHAYVTRTFTSSGEEAAGDDKDKATLVINIIIPAEQEEEFNRAIVEGTVRVGRYMYDAAVAGEVVYGIVIRSYAVQPLYMLIFPTVLIISLTKLLRGLADGDKELFILVMLYAYNMGRRPEAYSVGYMTVAMIMFVLYTGAANAVRLVRHRETSRYGAFVPAMALSYLITECVVMQ